MQKLFHPDDLLPFRENKLQLDESREITKRCLMHVERKFKVNPNFHKQYSEFMREYIELNI